MRAAKAGLGYFGSIFLLDMVLGTARILLVEPLTGKLGAVLIELPLMLLASWYVCRWLIDRLQVPPATSVRMTMGALAFALLMLAELQLSLFAVGGSASDHFLAYLRPAAFAGLLGQIAFAAFPLLVRRGGIQAAAR